MKSSPMSCLLAVLSATVAANAGIINSSAVDPTLFNLTTLATGAGLFTDITLAPDGSALISNSPHYGSTQPQLLYMSPSGTLGSSVYGSTYDGSSITGMFTGSVQLGNQIAVGTYGIYQGKDTITILQPGATPSSAMTAVASLRMNYPTTNWYHSTVGMGARPTPGVSGSYDLVINVGSEYDNVPTPSTDTVTLTGVGFSSTPSANLSGDSLYLIRINTNGSQPAVTAVQQVATGIRNVYGIAFNAAGDMYFTDNGMEELPPGSTQPVPTGDEPPQADELNMIPASQLGVGAPVDFGFPNCYVQYAYGSIPGVNVGTGCIQPVIAFQPVTDSNGVQHELEGPTDLAFAPSNFPAPFNNGIFVGFVGGEDPNDEAGMAYYSFATHSYTQFIQASNPAIHNILGLTSTDNALYFSDFTGTVYELQAAATPEPSSGLLVGLAMAVGARYLGRRRLR